MSYKAESNPQPGFDLTVTLLLLCSPESLPGLAHRHRHLISTLGEFRLQLQHRSSAAAAAVNYKVDRSQGAVSAPSCWSIKIVGFILLHFVSL